jgi:hypothetical protein
MARRRGPASVDPFADLEKKTEILERELAVQRAALDRLKKLGAPEPKADSGDSPISTTA